MEATRYHITNYSNLRYHIIKLAKVYVSYVLVYNQNAARRELLEVTFKRTIKSMSQTRKALRVFGTTIKVESTNKQSRN